MNAPESIWEILENNDEITINSEEEIKLVKKVFDLFELKKKLYKFNLEKKVDPSRKEWLKLSGLSIAETKTLLKSGNNACEKLIQVNLKLIISSARKYSEEENFSILELVKEGKISVQEAACRWFPLKDKGYKFRTFLKFVINTNIRKKINNEKSS